MNQLNDFLNEMKRVAEAISKIECPDEAVSYLKTKYELLENKSELIGNDLDSLFELSTKERYLTKKDLHLNIEKINTLFRTNQTKYQRSGYYDWEMGDELRKFNDLFDLLRKFLQNLGSTHSKKYSYQLLKEMHEEELSKVSNKTITNLNESSKHSTTVLGGTYTEESIKEDNSEMELSDHRKEIHLKLIDIEGLCNHLSPYFDDPKELLSVLNGNVPQKKILFLRPSTELLYVFNKLKLNGKIVEERKDLINWLLKHFRFMKNETIYKPSPKPFYKKYREDIENIPKKHYDILKIEVFYKDK